MAVTPKGRIGLGGGMDLIHGTFTHTVGATEETYVIDGILACEPQIFHNSGSEKVSVSHDASQSASGYKTTITFEYPAGVSAGRFLLHVLHGS